MVDEIGSFNLFIFCVWSTTNWFASSALHISTNACEAVKGVDLQVTSTDIMADLR